MITEKIIYWNDEDLNSIKKAERKKFNLENKGFNLIEYKSLTLNKKCLIYRKEVLKWK